MIKIIIGDSRCMNEIGDNAVDFIVTSPPYWYIKDYCLEGQIGYGQSLHEYLKSLYLVWDECYRVLKPGMRLCVNTGDQFLRSIIYGRYKVAPLHAEVISQCEQIGFDYMGSIIWQKKTTMNTTGGASVMGSYPYPPNGLVEIDYEFILIFKKTGNRFIDKEIKEKSVLSKDEWKEYFSGHWSFPGEKQINHEAMFPEELPKRLIKMFTFIGDTVLDPFLGSGTTAKAALNLQRNCIGYEINEKYLPIIRNKIGLNYDLFGSFNETEVIRQTKSISAGKSTKYIPSIQDAKPIISPDKFKFNDERLYKVVKIVNEVTLELDTGLIVKLLGIERLESQAEKALKYLNEYVKGKEVFIRFDPSFKPHNGIVPAYMLLKNKIFINKEMVRHKFATISGYEFKHKSIFVKASEVE